MDQNVIHFTTMGTYFVVIISRLKVQHLNEWQRFECNIHNTERQEFAFGICLKGHEPENPKYEIYYIWDSKG
jgi:hypothetical protein